MMKSEYIEVKDSKYTIIFVHGIIGSPVRFNDLYPLIGDNFSYVKVVLDGHGKKAKDFSKTSLIKWEKQISDLLDSLKNKNQKVIFVGHSMGCLFGLLESLKNDNIIEQLFLLNVPLRPKVGLVTIKECFKCAFVNPKYHNEMTKVLIENTSVEVSKNPFVYLGWIPRFFDLFKEIKRTRKLIDKIKTPCICFHCLKDELVRNKALNDLKKNKDFEIHVLNNSGHYYLVDEEKEELKNRFSQMLNEFN